MKTSRVKPGTLAQLRHMTKGGLQELRIAIRYIAIVLFLSVASPLSLSGQTPPCGVAFFHSSDGPKTDERFLSASPEVVKQDILKALPALGYVVRKDQGLHIEAIQDLKLLNSIWLEDEDAGFRRSDGTIVSGPVVVDIKEANQAGTQGSQLSVEFRTGFLGHKGSNAGPLAAETECLVKLLGTNDPSKNPRGDAPEKSSAPRAIALPAGTPMKVLLFAPMYSKDYKKDHVGRPIQFEVAEDVVVDGATVFRRGALAVGHLTDFKNAGGYGRHATLEFTFDTATGMDGQKIPVTGEIQQIKGGRTSDQLQSTARAQLALGWLIKGADILVRAGTEYDLEVSGQSLIQTGAN
jgi:hypothetical protein